MFLKICWAVTLAVTVVGAFIFMGSMWQATSAPQQAAAASMIVALIVIPYVFTRAIEGLSLRSTKPFNVALHDIEPLAPNEAFMVEPAKTTSIS